MDQIQGQRNKRSVVPTAYLTARLCTPFPSGSSLHAVCVFFFFAGMDCIIVVCGYVVGGKVGMSLFCMVFVWDVMRRKERDGSDVVGDSGMAWSILSTALMER